MTSDFARVVVTGMGVASPLGCTVAGFWQRLLAGESGVAALLEEEFAGLPSRIGARVADFDAAAFFDRKEARRMSRASQLALVAGAEAISQARLHAAPGDDVAVFIGSSIGGFSASDPFFRDYYTRGKQSALVIPLSMNSGPSANLSIRYGFEGPTLTVDAACASAAHSIAYAFNLIRTGMLDIAVTGGADSPFSRGVVQAWGNLHALSTRNDDPARACRPFSADRDGMVLGEGAGVLVLESEASAARRRVAPLAIIEGYGASSDSFHLTRPSVEGPARALEKALRDARLTPDDIGYINAHATGTAQNDANETAAIRAAFGARAGHIPVVGNKAALGHSIGASGALELIGVVLSLRDQVVPPTLNYTTPDPACDLDYVVEGARPVSIRHALSSSFAFGGSNAVLVVGKI